MEAGQWRGMDKQKLAEDQAAQQGAAKVAPKPYMSAQYKEDTMRTTGQLFCSHCTSPLIILPHISVCCDGCTCTDRGLESDTCSIESGKCLCMCLRARPLATYFLLSSHRRP